MAAGKDKQALPDADGITRRDFLHDVSLLAGAAVALNPALLLSTDAAAQGEMGRYYPPTRTGMRGSHPGAFEIAHALARRGASFPGGTPTGEEYDLVVVGAGISGLAAAYFFRQKHGPGARILLLDNHDDFGGHAKRNEFHQAGEMQLAWGGAVNIEYWKYSAVGNRLLRELGIDIKRLLADFEFNWGTNGTGLERGIWFDRETFGRDTFVPFALGTTPRREEMRAAIPLMPVSETAREAFLRFVGSEVDVLAGMGAEERVGWAHRTRYVDFLRDAGGLPDEIIMIFSQATMGYWGVRSEVLSVAEGIESGLPGAHLLNLPGGDAEEEQRSAMFPDGNASIARLLVRALIPEAFPGMRPESDPFDIVTADLDYEQLDRDDGRGRLRLNSTVLNVEHDDDGGVKLTYARDGELYAVRGTQCVLACYNRIIPHICPSLPQAQKDGLAQCIKRPMGTMNVVLRQAASVQASGISSAYLPGSLLQLVNVVNGVNAGPYRTTWDPTAPRVLQFYFGVPPENPAGLSAVEQSRAGQHRLLNMSFEDFEREARRVLSGIWGPHGLDVDTDILAITVNRWPHGYARDLLDLEDPAWLAKPGPYEIGRQPFGNIAIANSDSGADAYTHTAIDQAWRAVQDLPTHFR